MLSLRGSLVWLAAALVVLFTLAGAPAQERSVTLAPGADLPGFDYQILKDTNLDACQAACLGDRICRAFTFNQRAGWCFLKGEIGAEASFADATSGRVALQPSAEALAAAREGELPFPASYYIEEARRFAAELPTTSAPPPDAAYAQLVTAGDSSAAAGGTAAAIISYRQALAINDNDPLLWQKLADQAIAMSDEEAASNRPSGNYSTEFAEVATSAALNAFLQSETVAELAAALRALGGALERRGIYREAIATYGESLALLDDPRLQSRLDRVIAEHGFRVVSHDVDAEAATPRVCANFSDPIDRTTDMASYVVVEGAPQAAVETEYSQVCVEGLEHGRRYAIRLRAGLPAADAQSLRQDVALDVYVPDRPPFVGFANNAYVMPAGLGSGLPINAINAETAELMIYRIGDRSIATAVRNGIFMGGLDGYSAQDIADRSGELAWDGEIDLAQADARNAMAVTAVPVAEIIPDLEPGAYVITARVAGSEQEYWQEMATQWFIVSDLGLTALTADDGIHAFARSLNSAAPVAGASVRLIAVNNEVLGEATTDAGGRADFAPGLGRGTGGRAPQLIVVETDDDYAFLDIAKSPFDLTDRGVTGRPSPGPLDLFLTTERGVYRPGEMVFLTALLRDSRANAVTDLALTMQVQRPDGVTYLTEQLTDQGAGGYHTAIALAAEAMRGSWRIELYADPQDSPLGSATFLVEDFEPERLAFDVSAPDGPIDAAATTPITVDARYLYGATAPGLDVEADVVIRPTTTLAAHPGYTFGRLDDTVETTREPLGVIGTTDDNGDVVAEVSLPQPQATTRPLEAQLLLRLVDTNGRTVQRTLSRPVLATLDRIGVRPSFVGEALGQGQQASFDVIAVAPGGDTVDKAGLTWTLSRVETDYQWYRNGGTWRWEPITTTREVANGTLDATAAGPVTIGAPVDWGRHRLEIESTGPGATSTSYEFYAGYYYAQAGSDTPDTLRVALDKDAYAVGETASLRLEPQFAGTALVLVVDDRLIDMVAVDVPAEGTSVPLPVTDEWGPGAYVTAVLYRPASVAEQRMPARALGLAFADVEAGDRVLDVSLDIAEESRPRQPLTATVRIDNFAPGETAYVAVAAVDVGILNLTSFRSPAPDEWYFGQRQLGVEFRDLYGQLIDPTQGLPGAYRSGGDESAARLGTPPPTSVLVAFHSGVVALGADGSAEVTFDMPDFNGTVRYMAMAWSGDAVGHAVNDVIVRDPVVVNLSPPRFLRLDDQSRLLVEINNVAGPAGAYRVALLTGDGIATDAAESTVTLAAGERASLNLGLTGVALGNHDLLVTIRHPNGQALVKELTLGVRAASAPQTTSAVETIAPGETLRLDGARFAGLLPASGGMTLAIGPIARLDVPGLLDQLDRYPYGCAEQVSSRAFPLIYLNEVAQAIGMGGDDAIARRIDDAVLDLLSKQTSTGAFGLWGPFSHNDLWLDSYVTEFLLRAKDEGFDIPEAAVERALENLANQVSYASDFSNGGEAIAYALYDLARAGRATIGDLRYYFEARLDNFATPLAKAQLGAALALYGDRTRAAEAFAAALEHLARPEDRIAYRPDYGSRLRDTAAILALAGEFTPAGIDLSALAADLTARRDAARWTSTQEDAWTLVAASALMRQASGGSIAVDGEPLTGVVSLRYEQEHFVTAAVAITNNDNAPTELRVTVSGIPAAPPPARSEGFRIVRQYFLPDGTQVEPDTVRQNERLVVKLSLTARALGSGQYVVADPLPAGFEIENPNLASGGSVSDFAWLELDNPVHVESRTDQFVAAFRYSTETTRFATAYMVRAVSPGTFVQPGATVEDMYRPEFRANTQAGMVEITPAGP